MKVRISLHLTAEKEYDCLEAGEDAATEIMSLDNDSSDTWQAAANMGTSRTDCELVSINGNMYAIGGMGNNGYLRTVEKYNVADNAWQMITEIPNEVKGFWSCGIQFKDIYYRWVQ